MSSNQVFFFGIVTDCQDPDKLGRVKVAIESTGKDNESDWLPVLSMQAGGESGFFVMPDVDDQVLIAYLDQKHRQGIVLGGLWNPDAKPPKTEENTDSDLNADGKNNLKFYRSRSGLRLIFDDTDGKEKIQLLSADAKTRFEFDMDKKKAVLETDQDISISAKKKLTIEAESLSVKTDKSIGLEGAGISFESSKKLSIKADQDLTAEGACIKLN